MDLTDGMDPPELEMISIPSGDPWFVATVDALVPGEPDFAIQSAGQLEIFGGALGDKPFLARHIVTAHTLLQLAIALAFLPLVGQLARLTARLIPGQDESA